MILTAAVGCDTKVFERSLKASGYSGELKIFTECAYGSMPINSARYFAYRKYLEAIKLPEQLILMDSRDVVFQSSPLLYLGSTGLQVFCEDESMTLGSCPYNSEWLKKGFGARGFKPLANRYIICSGVIAGSGERVYKHIRTMCEMLANIPQILGIDQAVHNVICYNQQDVQIWRNEYSPVYTVGYIKRETVPITHEGVVNKLGVPCVVHQYDRHNNLKTYYERKFA